MTKRIFSEKEVNFMIEKYTKEKWTLKLLAEKFHCCPETIKRTLTKYNIEIIHHPRIKNNLFNDNYFEIINSEEKAYFLGLLFTDGNVYIAKNGLATISLEIHLKDKEILDKLKEETRCGSKISYRKRSNTEMVCLRMYSNKMANDLAKYGIVPNKTKMTKTLPLIDEKYERDFIRGLFDGDGSIYESNGYYHFTFCSYSKAICEQLQNRCDILIKANNKTKILKDKNKEIYRIHYNAKKLVEQLAIVLYKDSKCYLTRKYILAKNIFESKSGEDMV